MKQAPPVSPLDLHVLGTPPAFVLSQDQTLMFESLLTSSLDNTVSSLQPQALRSPRQRLASRLPLSLLRVPSSDVLNSSESDFFFLLLSVSFSRISPALKTALAGPVSQAASAIIPPYPSPCQYFYPLIVRKSQRRTYAAASRRPVRDSSLYDPHPALSRPHRSTIFHFFTRGFLHSSQTHGIVAAVAPPVSKRTRRR